MRLRTKKRLINLVGVLFLVAAFAILAEALIRGSSKANRSADSNVDSVRSNTVASADPVLTPADFGDLLEVRLQGKPAEAEPIAQKQTVVPQQQVQLPPSIILKGILYHPQHALAMFQLAGENQFISCSTGEVISGATVKRISEVEVVLTYQGKEFSRKLETKE